MITRGRLHYIQEEFFYLIPAALHFIQNGCLKFD
jgi:hypothetical protein